MANNVLINAQGLLEGKRLRKLTLKARLYYPLLLGLSNTFARLELDYDLLCDKFASFRDPDTANIADWFEEYEKAKLVLIYTGNDAGADEPTMWAQFDTPVEQRRAYATKEDAASPAPPEPLYTEWLKAIHGADWEKYNLTKYQHERQADISTKRADAGRKGAAATNAKRWGVNGNGEQNQEADFADSANQQNRLEVVVGVVEGVDEDEVKPTNFNLKSGSETESEIVESSKSSINQSGTGTAKTEAPAKSSANANIPVLMDEKIPSRGILCPHCNTRLIGKSPDHLANHIRKNHPHADLNLDLDFDLETGLDSDTDLDAVAEEFARGWNLLMQHNENFDPSKLPSKWKAFWTADFRKLLDTYPNQTVAELMAYSQCGSQREYNWNCKVFCSNCERNLKFLESMKKTSKWKPVWERYVAIVTTGSLPSEQEIESLDEQPKFNIEDAADELE